MDRNISRYLIKSNTCNDTYFKNCKLSNFLSTLEYGETHIYCAFHSSEDQKATNSKLRSIHSLQQMLCVTMFI